MKITLSELYKAMIEQEVPINFNNTIHSLEYCKTEIEFKEKDYMKTSEFKAELEKLGYRLNINTYIHRIKDNVTVAAISFNEVNTIDTAYGKNIPNELFSLMSHYASTPIAEREDEKLFNIQIIKGNRGRASWLYRYDDGISTSISAVNNFSRQQWTLEQIKEYGIDDETVYKRVPVED